MTAPSPNASSNGRKGLSTIQKFAVARSGNVAITFALAMPVLLLMIGLAIDYGSLIASRGVLQNAADAASLAGAKELGLADANRANVSAVVDAVVAAYVKEGTKAARYPLQIKSTVIDATGQPQQVKVAIRQTVPLIFAHIQTSGDHA